MIKFKFLKKWPHKLNAGIFLDVQRISHFQSREYFKLLPLYRQRPIVMMGMEDSEIVGYWLLFETPPNYLSKWQSCEPFSWFLRGLNAFYGPVIKDCGEECYRSYLLEFIRELKAFIIAGNYLFTNMTPPIYDARFIFEECEASLRQEGFTLEDAYTFFIHSNMSIEKLRGNLAKETRNKLNRASRQNIEVFEAQNEDDLMGYYNIRCENLKRNGFEVIPFRHFKSTWDSMHSSGIFRIFLSRASGHLLAGQMVFAYRRVLHLCGVAVSDYCIEKKLAGNDVLQWAIIEFGHREGYEIIDLVGTHPHTQDKKLKSIHDFKARWGGELIKFGTWKFNTESWRRKLVKAQKNLKSWIKKQLEACRNI